MLRTIIIECEKSCPLSNKVQYGSDPGEIEEKFQQKKNLQRIIFR